MGHEAQSVTLTEASSGTSRRPYRRPPESFTRNSIVPRGSMVFSLRDETIPAATVGNTLSYRISCQLDGSYAYAIRSANAGIENETNGTRYFSSTAKMTLINWMPEIANTAQAKFVAPFNDGLAHGSSGALFSAPYNVSTQGIGFEYTLIGKTPAMILPPTGAVPFLYFDFITTAISSIAHNLNFALILDYFDVDQYYSGFSKQTVPTD